MIVRLRLWIGICGSLLVVTGIAVGFVAGRATNPTRSGTNAGVLLPESSRYWMIRSRDVWEKIGVDAAQRERLDAVLEEHYKEDLRLSAERNKLAADAQERIATILTAEQRPKLADALRPYMDARIDDETVREIAMLRREIGLGFDQEPDTYQAVYGLHLSLQETFQSLRKRGEWMDRDKMRKALDDAHEWFFSELANVLTAEQLATYRNIVERRRTWTHHRRGGRSKDGKGPPGRSKDGKGPPVDKEPVSEPLPRGAEIRIPIAVIIT